MCVWSSLRSCPSGFWMAQAPCRRQQAKAASAFHPTTNNGLPAPPWCQEPPPQCSEQEAQGAREG